MEQISIKSNNASAYLDFLIDPSFQGVNRLFVLLFKKKEDRKVYTKYYLPTVETKDDNVMIDGQYFFDRPVKKNSKNCNWSLALLVVF